MFIRQLLAFGAETISRVARLLLGIEDTTRDADPASRAGIEASVAELRRSFEAFTNAGGMKALARLLEGAELSSLTRDVIALVDLIEDLLQAAAADVGAERRELKWTMAKGGILRVLRARASLELLGTPLLPVVLELALDLLLPVLDGWLEDRKLWKAPEAEATKAGLTLFATSSWLTSAIRWASRILNQLYWKWALRLNPIGAHSARVVAAHSSGTDIDTRVGAFMRLLQELFRERQLLLAGARLVTAAVTEAEELRGADGKTKMLHARALLRAFVEELGGLWAWTWLEPIALVGIDLTVHLLNKRGEFHHHDANAAESQPAPLTGVQLHSQAMW